MLSMNLVDCYKVCLLVRLFSWSEAPRKKAAPCCHPKWWINTKFSLNIETIGKKFEKEKTSTFDRDTYNWEY